MKPIKKLNLENNSIRTLLFYAAIACVINLIVFFIINKLSFVHFEMNDDFTIQNLLNGSLGEHYTHFAHSNFILSSILSGLYSISAAVNWYGLYLFLALLLSCSFIGAILMDKFSLKTGIALYLLTVPLLFGLFLTYFTYTLVCYAMLACALASLIYGFYSVNAKTRKFLYIFSVIMLVSSVLLREEIIASAFVYFVALAILFLIKYKKQALKVCLSIAIGFLAIGAFTLADTAYFNADEERSDYLAFHEARIQLVDHEPLNYGRDQYVFDTVGWSASDVETFKSFTYPDDKQFSVQNMEYIYESMEQTRYMTDMNAIVANITSTFGGNNLLGNAMFVLICLFGVFAVAFVSQKKKLFKLFTVAMIALPFLFLIVFAMLYRSVPRVAYPHFLLSTIVLLFFIDKKTFSQTSLPKVNSAVFMLIIAVFSMGMASLLYQTYSDGAAKSQNTVVAEVRDAYEAMYLNSDSTYIYPISSPLLAANESYGIFHAFEEDYFINNRLLGGWDTRSPSYIDFKERNNLSSLPADLLDNEDVYLVIPNADQLTSYFYNNHGTPVKYEVVQQISPSLQAVKVVTATAEEIGTVYLPE